MNNGDVLDMVALIGSPAISIAPNAARILFVAPDRRPEDPARRRDDEIAAGEPEQVICSCRGHGDLYVCAPVDDKDSARRRDPHP